MQWVNQEFDKMELLRARMERAQWAGRTEHAAELLRRLEEQQQYLSRVIAGNKRWQARHKVSVRRFRLAPGGV